MRLRTRLLLPIVTIFLAVALIAVAAAAAVSRADKLHEAEAEIAWANERRAGEVEQTLDGLLADVAYVASAKANVDLQAALLGDDIKGFLIEKSVADFLAQKTQGPFMRVAIADADGIETTVYADGERVYESFFHLSGKSAAVLASLEADVDQRLIWVEGGKIWTAVAVVDQRDAFRGAVVGQSDPVALFGHTYASEDMDGGVYASGLRLDAGPSSEGDDDLLTSSRDVTAGVRPSGEPFVLTSVTTVPRSDALVAARPVALVFAGTIAGLLAAIVLVGLAIARIEARPIEQLSAAVERIGAGDYATRVKVGGAQEIRSLARGVHTMADQLAAREESLRVDAESRARTERLATLGSLSAGIAHEVNNPLTFMRGNSELLLFDIDDELAAASDDKERQRLTEQKRLLEANIHGIDHIARIVQSLRLLAKPVGAAQRVDLAAVVDATLALTGPQVQDRARVELHLQRGTYVNASPEALGQIVLNLLLNAGQAVPAVDGVIRVAVVAQDGAASLTVEDNGPGVPADAKENLFKPFFTTKPTGTGLGLSISHKIASDAGGSLAYRDRPGGGASFVLSLPRA